MRFARSSEMKVSLLPGQEKQLSSRERIKAALPEKDVLGFDVYDGENTLIGFAMLRKYAEGGCFLWDYAIGARFQNRHYGT